ncbi:MAG: hypothetical protein KDD84_09905 [Caldilineaceae bacterium]|nr:hypothetical protein [Caldilineaceae bacterium]
MTTTIRVKGIYNGKTIELLEAVTMPPDTVVEVLVPELEPTRKERLQQQIQDLVDKGVLTHAAMDRPRDLDFHPVTVAGKPVSETIIEERR